MLCTFATCAEKINYSTQKSWHFPSSVDAGQALEEARLEKKRLEQKPQNVWVSGSLWDGGRSSTPALPVPVKLCAERHAVDFVRQRLSLTPFSHTVC